MEEDKPIVYLNIEGGLGNQIFQVVTSYAYSKRYNGCLKVNKNKQYDDGRPLYWDSILYSFKPYLVDTIPNNLIQWYERYPTEFNNITPLTNQGIHLHGYLQSSLYFNDIKEEVKELLKPCDDILNNLLSKYNKLLSIKDRVVVVHARRTDYCINQHKINFHGPLTKEYYKEAIKRISTSVENPVYLLCSDDTTYWTDLIKDIPELNKDNIFILENEDEINTFYLLQQFKYYIIANSTFSWWAVWLSNSERVIAPSKWFGPWGPQSYKDIYEPGWELI
jgi:hypothetical protein